MIRRRKSNAGDCVSPPAERSRHARRAVGHSIAQALLTGTWVDFGDRSLHRNLLPVPDARAPIRQRDAVSCLGAGCAFTHWPR